MTKVRWADVCPRCKGYPNQEHTFGDGCLKKGERMTTYLHKVKCMACSLHFIVCSWDEKWVHEKYRGCPECGDREHCMIWTEESDQFIFQHVPGSAPLVGMGLAPADAR